MTFQELSAKIGREIGLGASYAGTHAAYQSLTLDDQIRLTNALKAHIRANPEGFSDVAKTVAAKPDISAPDYYTIGDAAADFVDEFANQAQQINPLSSLNRTATALTLVGLAAVGVAVFAWTKAGGKLPTLPRK